MEINIEKEIQARVDFKMNELLTAIQNRADTNWAIAFKIGSQKHSYYWEAFEQMKSMFQKELEMSYPYDIMSELNRRKKKHDAVDKIMETFCQRGVGDYYRKERQVAMIIDECQEW